MTIPPTPDQDRELAAFPAALRELIDAELAAGNPIVEIGHGFPAPPAGAYVLFARSITTRKRASDHRLSWLARNSSLSSGEFTDSQRFYFVVEPPAEATGEPRPEPVETSMNARERETATRIPPGFPHPPELAAKPVPPGRINRRRDTTTPACSGPVTVEEVASGVRFQVPLRDVRSLLQVRAWLERMLVVPFTPILQGNAAAPPRIAPATSTAPEPFRLVAQTTVNGAGYGFELRLDGAAARCNVYTLTVAASWAHLDPRHHDYYRRQAQSWFEHWTGAWPAAKWKKPPKNVVRRHQAQMREVVAEDERLGDAQTVRDAIVAGMKSGGWYSASDKEGSTRIAWTGSRFVMTGEGEHPTYETFADAAEFLDRLRRFCGQWIDRHPSPTDRSDAESWRLVLRLMESST